jgi:oxygen-independent coproporphyrinogen-3 oxidase
MLAWRGGWLYVADYALGATPENALALYLHLPFCDHKCAYCDFNSYAGLDHLIPRYVEALSRETALWREIVAGWTVQTVFFGGGTPSLTPLPLLQQVLRAVSASFSLDSGVEITLEANPGTVDEPYLRGLQALGVNRLSIGVQSFDDDELCRLDRIHDAGQAVAAYRAARLAGFDNVNLDLIFGLEGQDLAGWRRNLARASELAPEHLSLYALTVEPGTKLGWQVREGLAPEPDPDLQADMYELTTDAMAAGGYAQYEISNWSLPGRQCRHNLVYWRNDPYLGLGAGAHSRFLDRRFSVVSAPATYIRRVADATGGLVGDNEPLAGRYPQIAHEAAIDPVVDASDTLVLGLRLNEGVDLAAFTHRFGASVESSYGAALDELEAWGILERREGRLRLTNRGRLVSNEAFVRLLA